MSNGIWKAGDGALPAKSTNLLISKDGYTFDSNSNRWMLNKDRTLVFHSNVLNMETRTSQGLRSTLARYAEELSASHTCIMYALFRRMIRVTEATRLTPTVILNWKAHLGKDREWELGNMRGLLIRWFDYGFYGVPAEIVELLGSLRLAGNEKGVAIANRCPYSGAFTENEVLAINDELNRLLRDEDISLECYAYVSLTQATARRPIQLRQLKACDLLQDTIQGARSYRLNIPRSKQRGIGFRGAFNRLDITEDLYLILKNLLDLQIAAVESIFKLTLDEKHKRKVPLFLDVSYCRHLFSSGASITDILDLDVMHLAAKDLGQSLMNLFAKKQRAISERTGDIIHITSRRFRNTLGTNLGRKGFGVNIIAEALDQSDSQNAKVYTENTADTVQYIDKAVGKELARYANAFLGRVIETLEDGERGDDPTARIPNDKNEVVGACGTNSFCVNGYESCYVCHKFRPLLEAPHEQFLENLYKEKEQRLKNTGSIQYANVKDRLILAVEQVVSMCDEIKVRKGGA